MSKSDFETKTAEGRSTEEKITKVFMTGCMRSGTTFLANYLNSVDKCVFLRDSFMAIFRTSLGLGIKSFTEALPIQSRNILLFNLKGQLIQSGINKLDDLRCSQFTTLNELFDLGMKTLVDENTKVFGVKVIIEERWIKRIIEETDMKIIYLVRDLRDVLLSSANAFDRYDRNRFSRYWFQGVTEALENNNPRMIFIKFEDLILNPGQELERLSAFLGLKLDHSLKEIKDISGPVWGDNSSFHDVNKLFDSITVNRWKKNLDSKEVEYGSVKYKKLMNKLGYEENRVPFFKGLKLKIIGFWEVKRTVIRNLLFVILVRKAIRFCKKLFRILGKKITQAIKEKEEK